MYLVLRLIAKDSFVLKDTSIPVEFGEPGLVGVVPVYETIEEAEKQSENGKYAIVAIQTK